MDSAGRASGEGASGDSWRDQLARRAARSVAGEVEEERGLADLAGGVEVRALAVWDAVRGVRWGSAYALMPLSVLQGASRVSEESEAARLNEPSR